MDPKRVNVPSRNEQLSFHTSKICPSSVLGSLVRNLSWRSEWVLTYVHTFTADSFLCGLRLNNVTAFSLFDLNVWGMWTWDAVIPFLSSCWMIGALRQ
jgi:hypothetical protein